MRLTRGMRLTTVALACFWILFCDGSAGDHILTNIRMTFPRNASNNCGVDVFLNFVLRWHCLFVWSLVCLCVLFFLHLLLFYFLCFLSIDVPKSWRIFWQRSAKENIIMFYVELKNQFFWMPLKRNTFIMSLPKVKWSPILLRCRFCVCL